MADHPGELGHSRCGTYGEDTLVARGLSDGTVELEVAGKDGAVHRWIVGATSTLSVTSAMHGTIPMVGIETDLALDGQAITHFEFDFAWGGAHDEDVAKLAVAIAAHAKCALEIAPLRIAGEQHLGSIRCGAQNREQLHAIEDERSQVRIVNPMTNAKWKIAAGDTLVVRIDGSGTELERQGEQLARFECSEEELVAFVRRVCERAGCAMDRVSGASA